MDSSVLINGVISFISFSMLASGIYIFNDIVDIEHDRKHNRKKNRPIASGELSIFSAYAILLVCLMGGGVVALYIGNTFF